MARLDDLCAAAVNAKSDALVLDVVHHALFETGESWEHLGRKPQSGYHLYLLTNGEKEALSQAVRRMLESADRAADLSDELV